MGTSCCAHGSFFNTLFYHLFWSDFPLPVYTSREEILRRRRRNEETGERGQLEEDTLQHAFDMFEEPTDAEYPLVYDGSVSIDEWVREYVHISTEGRVSNQS